MSGCSSGQSALFRGRRRAWASEAWVSAQGTLCSPTRAVSTDACSPRPGADLQACNARPGGHVSLVQGPWSGGRRVTADVCPSKPHMYVARVHTLRPRSHSDTRTHTCTTCPAEPLARHGPAVGTGPSPSQPEPRCSPVPSRTLTCPSSFLKMTQELKKKKGN